MPDPRGWKVWSLPAAARVHVCAVVAGAAVLLALAAREPLAASHAALLGACALTPVLSLLVLRHVGQAQYRRVSLLQDQQDLWLLAALVAVPSPTAAAVALPVAVVGHLLRHRAFRAAEQDATPALPHRTAYSASQMVLCAAAAHVVLTAASSAGLGLVVAGAAAAAVFVLLNALLLGAVVSLAAGEPRDLLRIARDGIGADAALAFTGVVVGIAALSSAWVLLLVAPLGVLAQRALLHGVLVEQLQTDRKTGLASMQFWQERANEQLQGVADGGPGVTVMVLDLDHFKQVNDEHGHLAGDDVLQQTAARLLASVRPGDLVGRFGGEEFVVLLPRTEAREALEVGARLLSALSGHPVLLDDGSPVHLTCSIGLASASPGERRDLPGLLRAADAALYDAKRGGRNRVHASAVAVPAPRSGASPARTA